MNRRNEPKFKELIDAVESSGNEGAITSLNLLLNTEADTEGVDFEPLRNVVLSSKSNEAIESLVELLYRELSKECDVELAELLCAIVEEKIPSKSGDLTETSERIQSAIKSAFGAA